MTPPEPCDRATLVDDIVFMVKVDDLARRPALEVARDSRPAGARGDVRPQDVIHATLVFAGKADSPRTATFVDSITGFGHPIGVPALAWSAMPPGWSPLRKPWSQAPRRLGLRTVGRATRRLTVGNRFAALPQAWLVKPVVWAIDEFVLVRSLMGQGKHDELCRWGFFQ